MILFSSFFISLRFFMLLSLHLFLHILFLFSTLITFFFLLFPFLFPLFSHLDSPSSLAMTPSLRSYFSAPNPFPSQSSLITFIAEPITFTSRPLLSPPEILLSFQTPSAPPRPFSVLLKRYHKLYYILGPIIYLLAHSLHGL